MSNFILDGQNFLICKDLSIVNLSNVSGNHGCGEGDDKDGGYAEGGDQDGE